jgi:hypothetical protein
LLPPVTRTSLGVDMIEFREFYERTSFVALADDETEYEVKLTKRVLIEMLNF